MLVGQAFWHAVAHRGDQRMGGAEVDADSHAPLVRIGRLAGFGDLQQGHGARRALGPGVKTQSRKITGKPAIVAGGAGLGGQAGLLARKTGKAAIASEPVEPAMQVVGETLDEHQRPDLLRRASRIALLVDA